MLKNRVQISRPNGVDGLVCDAGNLELDALVVSGQSSEVLNQFSDRK